MSESARLLRQSYSPRSSPTLNEVDYNSSTTALPPQFPTFPSNPARNKVKRKWVPDAEDSTLQRNRTLVLCFDGTGDQFDDDNSNVIQFLTALKKDDQRYQLVYYQAGIGTYTSASFVTPLMSQVSKTLDEMFAWNLGSHVMDGYNFLMQNYTAGDKISIFGFSRGAYTARALAGMIQKVGLLPAYNTQQVPFAWAMYVQEDADGWRNSQGFKKTFSIDVTIDFVGVWDTVASVGIIQRELPFVANNTAIRVFRHAIALDEHRAKFMPNFYHSSESEQKAVSVANAQGNGENIASPTLTKKRRPHVHKTESQLREEAENAKLGTVSDAKEVWFAGCHCDVGGGSVRNGTPHSLARIPLRWMIRECFATNTGIIFDADILKNEIGIDADNLFPAVIPRPQRKSPSKQDKIAEPESQGFFLWNFVKFVGAVAFIPITLVYTIVAFPIKHFWLLLRYSPFGKLIPKWTPFLRHKHRDAPPHVEAPLPEREPFISEEEEELRDALSPEYDQLQIRWFWWIIELLPLRFRNQKGSRDDFFVRSNLGRGRKIYGDARLKGLKIHRSVKTRLEVLDKKGRPAYRPRAWFKVGERGQRKVVEEWNIDDPNSRTHWEWVD